MVISDAGPNLRLAYTRIEVALKHGEAAKWDELVPHRDDV